MGIAMEYVSEQRMGKSTDSGLVDLLLIVQPSRHSKSASNTMAVLSLDLINLPSPID